MLRFIATALLLAATLGLAARPALAQGADKPRLAIREIAATDAVTAAARSSGQQNVLDQILQGANSQLTDAITQSRRFDVVARADLGEVLKEQDLNDSGLVDQSDPQAARAGKLAAAGYLATVTVDNYQDITETNEFAGQFGRTASERRTIQIQATLKIYDATTGVLKESEVITLDDSEYNEVLPGSVRDGRATNALIGRVTRSLAVSAANGIMNALAPAKVIGYTMGVITLNRGEGTGIEPGQIWQVFFAGGRMIDPDTGEDLGAEEVSVGWARVTEVNEKFSKAEAIEDRGIDYNAIMRLSLRGLPASVDPNARSSGSAATSGRATNRPAPAQPATLPAGQPAAQPGSGPPAGGTGAASTDRAVRLAIIVRDVSPEVPDQKVEVLESYLTSTLTAPNVEIISRALVLNAVSSLASAGPNQGTGEDQITRVERLLSDQSSARAFAQLLGADGLVVATISSLERDQRRLQDPALKVNTDVVTTTLSVPWSVVDGATGGSLAAGIAESQDTVRNSGTLQRSPTSVDTLLRDAARQVGPLVARAMADSAVRRPAPAEETMVAVKFRIEMQDLSVPEIREIDGEWIVAANRYQLVPLGCNVIVDGVLAGSAPGVVMMQPGPHRIRIDRPDLEPVDQFIVARDNLDLNIPVRLTEEGRRRWREQTMFFESMKDRASLRKNEEVAVAAFAEFLKNSSLKIDTSSLQTLDLGGRSVWEMLLTD